MSPKPLFDHPIAHRGLHDRSRGIIENTASAFEAACQRGYTIECDVQLSRDGIPMIFHDDDLDRLTGVPGPVNAKTMAELASYKLLGSATGDTPQRFSEFLAQVDGRVLLQIELKQQPDPATTEVLAQTVLDALQGYRGPVTLESFDPRLIVALRKRGAAYPIGIITYAYNEPEWDGHLAGGTRFMLRHLLHWPTTRFDFISCRDNALDLPAVKLFRSFGIPVTTWTIKSSAAALAVMGKADQIVFEGLSQQLPPEAVLSASVVNSVAEIPAAVWNGLAPSHAGIVDNPFVDHAFFLAAEQSGSAARRTGWQPQHLLLSDPAGEPVGVLPLYLKSHSQGEYVFDHGWADAFARAGGDYYPKLQCAVPFTPVTGPRALAHDAAHRTALLRAAETLATQNNISSVHMTFATEAEAEIARGNGWLIRHDTQYHWQNHGFGSFEDFLGTLSSRHRKVTRRERRDALAADGLTVKWLTGKDLTETVWDQFFEFYQDTGSRKWGRPYLTRSFFSLLGAAMANRILLMFAYDGDEPIAGTFSLIGQDRLYGRYWGATRQVPFLHFELCYYQAIDYAIAHKLGVVEAGAQGEHKLARGYEPTTTRSAHWIGHPGLRDAVARFVREERASVEHEQEVLERYTPFRHGDPPR